MAIPVEDEVGRAWDRCLADGLLKLGGGIVLGGVSSLFLFRRRKWPLIMGSGFGIGLAYSNCEKELNSLLSLPKVINCSGSHVFIYHATKMSLFFLENGEEMLNFLCTSVTVGAGLSVVIRDGGGLAVGVVISLLTAKSWPALFGFGVGCGMAYDRCYNYKRQHSVTITIQNK